MVIPASSSSSRTTADRLGCETNNFRLLKVVDAIDENIYGMAKESTGSNVGTGGMATKLAAAKIATLSGTDMIIANGGDVRILQDIFENDYVGTLFTANENANFNLANYIMETIG